MVGTDKREARKGPPQLLLAIEVLHTQNRQRQDKVIPWKLDLSSVGKMISSAKETQHPDVKTLFTEAPLPASV